jgi:hypothetical protein
MIPSTATRTSPIPSASPAYISATQDVHLKQAVESHPSPTLTKIPFTPDSGCAERWTYQGCHSQDSTSRRFALAPANTSCTHFLVQNLKTIDTSCYPPNFWAAGLTSYISTGDVAYWATDCWNNWEAVETTTLTSTTLTRCCPK